jgi:NitT/TauT family transport system permease protein
MLKPLGKFISVIRYLPLVGLTFYVSIFFKEARMIQVAILVMFMSTFLTTSVMQMIKDIPLEEYDHARTLGCTKWEVLYEVVIVGRLDYVIELVRQNLAIVWVMLVTVETGNVASGGLAILIFEGQKTGNSGVVIAAQVVIIITGLFIDYSLTKARQLTFRFSKF